MDGSPLPSGRDGWSPRGLRCRSEEVGVREKPPGVPRVCVSAELRVCPCRLKENAQRKSCELSLIWGKMRSTACETAFQTALRNRSKEVGGEVSIYGILVKGECMQSSTYFCRRFLLVSCRLLLVTRSRRHQEGF